MTMFANSVQILGSRSSAVFVDPLSDFVRPDGPFQKAYGCDAAPVIAVIERMAEMARAFQGKMKTVLNSSSYREDQFINDNSNLRGLCSTEEGRKSVINPVMFSGKVQKTTNSLLSAGAEAEALLDEDALILCGLTGTSCVPKTVDDILSRKKNQKIPHIVLPLDVIASRASRMADQQQLIRNYGLQEERIVVVQSWKNIGIYRDDGTALHLEEQPPDRDWVELLQS